MVLVHCFVIFYADEGSGASAKAMVHAGKLSAKKDPELEKRRFGSGGTKQDKRWL
jgi:hypothetical protein